MNEREKDLFMVAIKFDMASREIRDQALSILTMFGSRPSAPQEPGHKQGQTV